MLARPRGIRSILDKIHPTYLGAKLIFPRGAAGSSPVTEGQGENETIAVCSVLRLLCDRAGTSDFLVVEDEALRVAGCT